MLNTGDYSETGVNTSRMWIGITDSLSEGDYQWMSGEEVLFENWAIGHPQDIYEDIDYGLINGGILGQWLSKQNDNEYRFVMEVESIGSPITKYYVSQDGEDFYNGYSESPFATIQHGIDVAAEGDTVFVYDGIYVENINFNGKDIVVIGESRENTIIDGNQDSSVVIFESGETSAAILKGFTLTNGGNTYAGGGIQINNSSPTLSDLLIENNIAESDGAGIYIAGECQSLISDLVISNNECNLGAGVFVTSSSDKYFSNIYRYRNFK